MKTYALDLNGVPKLAFRAKDDAAAANWPKSVIGRTCVRGYEGTLTVRSATLPEQAEWRQQSIAMEELDEECLAERLDEPSEPKRGSYGSTPDHYVLMLDPDDHYVSRRIGSH